MKPNLQYWLRWEVGLCFLSVLACVAVAFYLLWRYEGTRARSGTDAAQPGAEAGERSPGVVYDGEAWRPYLNVHPYWLFAYRMASFLFFTTFTVIIVKSRGHTIFYYYTEWTFLLVTLYFGVASWISIYGCRKVVDSSVNNGGNAKKIAGFGGYLLQIMYQTAAGAAMLTDTVFWGIICPARLHHRRDIDFLSVVMHSANVLLLLGEATLNSLHFPWFRIAYFCLWTCAYVIFQWTVHASSLMIWPYPFLDLSSKLAPLWYVVAGVMQIPCYLVFGLVINKLKKHLQQSPSAPVRATA